MIQYQINDADQGNRLDKFLVMQRPELTRTTIKKMIDESFVLVNEVSSKPNYKLKLDDIISVTDYVVEEQHIVAEDIPLSIVYEDDDILVINKANNMVVHPGAGIYSGTLVNGLMYHINNLSTVNGDVRPGIVHRIDKETTGLLVVAKNDQAHQALANQLVAKTLQRTYLALVHGQIMDKKVVIDAPIGRDKNERTKMMVTANNSKKAKTNLEVINIFDDYTLVKCTLETGRTHQIRVHLNYIKHPVVGDPKYGYRKDDKTYGQYLHAYKLGLIHPKTNEFMEFYAPLPQEFVDRLDLLNYTYVPEK